MLHVASSWPAGPSPVPLWSATTPSILSPTTPPILIDFRAPGRHRPHHLGRRCFLQGAIVLSPGHVLSSRCQRWPASAHFLVVLSAASTLSRWGAANQPGRSATPRPTTPRLPSINKYGMAFAFRGGESKHRAIDPQVWQQLAGETTSTSSTRRWTYHLQQRLWRYG